VTATLDMLRHIPLFAGLAEEDLRLVSDLGSVRSYERGMTIFRENDPGDSLHIVLLGTVKICRLARDGREKTLAFVGEGEFFGEMALLDGGARSAMAQALEPARTLAIYRSDFAELLKNRPHISLEVIRVLSCRLRQTNAQLMDTIFRNARSRAAKALVELGQKHGATLPAGVRITLKLTHQELANLVGTARETISRILVEFQDEGLVQADGRRLVVLDAKGLAELAELPPCSWRSDSSYFDREVF
jgi:CRP/FNR family cyclic AMP-dependent transcriptional regulator